MKKFFESIGEHTKNIIDFEKKKMLPWTKQELKSHQHAKVYYICGKKYFKSLLMIKIIELGTNVILQVNIEAQHIVFVI